MKKIEINIAQYPEDCEIIQSILAARGYEASFAECEALWSKFSDSMSAGWLGLGTFTHDEIFSAISPYINN